MYQKLKKLTFSLYILKQNRNYLFKTNWKKKTIIIYKTIKLFIVVVGYKTIILY